MRTTATIELPGQLGVELHRGLKAAKFKSKEPTDAEFARLVGELRRHYELIDRRQNGRMARPLRCCWPRIRATGRAKWCVEKMKVGISWPTAR